MGWNVDIDLEKCTGDEECVNVCPSGVLEMEDGKAVVANIDECLGCESCVEVCVSGAIDSYRNVILGLKMHNAGCLAGASVLFFLDSDYPA